MPILPETILSIPDIKVVGDFNSDINGVSIDTRSLKAGELFVAFFGTQVDGHDFIQNAISRGASAVMASTNWEGSKTWDSDIPLILSGDPVKTLGLLATAHRNRFDIPLIAITGTNGKTSTKSLLAHLLQTQYTVLYTDGNFNNHIGLPISLLSLDDNHEIAVIEMGASAKGDIEYLCNIALPNQGLITNISAAHTEFFNDIDTIQLTKGELFHHLAENDGQIFVNADDERVKHLSIDLPKQIDFGFTDGVEYRYQMQGPDHEGCYELGYDGHMVHLEQPGRVFPLNAAAALTIARSNGINSDQAAQALESYHGETGRMQKLVFGEVNFFNDAYNANPASAKAGFETLSDMQLDGRKILIFADMLELGDHSPELHRQTAKHMISAGFDYIFLVGLEVLHCVQYFKAQNISNFYHNVDKRPAIQNFVNLLTPGDTVYLKGSRGMKLEEFIDAYKEQK